MTVEDIARSEPLSGILLRRALATSTDFIVLGTALMILLMAFGEKIGPFASAGLSLSIWFAYFTASEAATGRTPGKVLFGVVVVDRLGQSPSVGAAFLRCLLLFVEMNLALLGPLPALIVAASSTYRQRVGDHLASTFVVRLDRLNLLNSP